MIETTSLCPGCYWTFPIAISLRLCSKWELLLQIRSNGAAQVRRNRTWNGFPIMNALAYFIITIYFLCWIIFNFNFHVDNFFIAKSNEWIYFFLFTVYSTQFFNQSRKKIFIFFVFLVFFFFFTFLWIYTYYDMLR